MHHTDAPDNANAERRYLRYIIQSSDVIQDMRVNVREENSDRVIWYKERFLSDEEIVDNVVHNPTSTICWTVHRPKRGWYIRLRSPSFPPKSFIQLLPVKPNLPYHVEAALSFSSRTNLISSVPIVKSIPSSVSDPRPPSIHSYPPTPPAVIVDHPSPTSVHLHLDEETRKQQKRPATQVTDFILAPLSSHLQTSRVDNTSFLSRALSILKSHGPHHSNSFTLCRLPPTPQSPPPYSPQTPHNSSGSPYPPIPLLNFHDRTPALMVRSVTGLLEIDQEEECMLGVDTSFWISIALTYLEFLEERESYLAALND